MYLFLNDCFDKMIFNGFDSKVCSCWCAYQISWSETDQYQCTHLFCIWENQPVTSECLKVPMIFMSPKCSWGPVTRLPPAGNFNSTSENFPDTTTFSKNCTNQLCVHFIQLRCSQKCDMQIQLWIFKRVEALKKCRGFVLNRWKHAVRQAIKTASERHVRTSKGIS